MANKKYSDPSRKASIPTGKREEEESRKLLETVFDTTNQAIVVFRAIYENDDKTVKDFKFLKINKVLKKMYGEIDPLGQSYLETTKYGVKMGLFDAFKEVMKTGTPLNQEFYFNKEGYDNWFQITARSQDDLLIATLEDITEQKTAHQQLIETLRFKQQLEATSPDVILIINLNNFSVRYINKDIFPEAGMTVERIKGTPLQNILPFIHPKDREKIIGFHRKLLKSKDDEIQEIELRLKLRNKSWEWFCVRGKIFQRHDENWVDEYVLLVSNITQQKNTMNALLRAERLSIQGEVARIFAHELRNPLASMGMAIDILKINYEGSQDKIRNYLDILSRSTKTLNNLVDSLLNSSNYSPPDLKKENLVEILNSTLDKASDRIYLNGITLNKRYKGKYYVLADKEKLSIALLNIIVNAIEATTPEKGIIEIEIDNQKTDCILRIKDNGHGLSEEEIDRIFDAFYTNKDSGIGIGLASVKNILTEHDADLNVKSNPTKGTCFSISFHNADHE